MIVVDASAVLAVLLREDDRDVFASAFANAEHLFISVASVFECSMKVQRSSSPNQDEKVDEFLRDSGFEILPIGLIELATARTAFGRYGKGMGHPAQLNFGDCFSYALATTRNLPLLFKGNDFSQTDIVSALPH
jgi:ribonuclease VapC